MEVIKKGTIRQKLYWIIQYDSQESLVFEDSKHNKIVIDYTSDNMKLISNNTFYVNGIYVLYPTLTNEGKATKKYIHSLLMENIPQPSEKHNTVDHINQIKTDNRMCNLRWATQSEQNSNRGKVARKKNARELPDEIKDIELPKYVVYYFAKATDQHYFQVEGHPNLNGKRPKTTKSKKITITEKLEQAKQMLKDLGTSEEQNELTGKRQELLGSYNQIISMVE